MNWGEFKKLLEDAGITDDWEIDYFDYDGSTAQIIKDERSKDGRKWVTVR